MGNWAAVNDQNVVTWVTYSTESDPDALVWLQENHPGSLWVRTYYSTPGKTYAGQGYVYDPITGDFTAPETSS